MHIQKLYCCVCNRMLRARQVSAPAKDIKSPWPCIQCKRNSINTQNLSRFIHDEEIDTPKHDPSIEPQENTMNQLNLNINLLRNDFQTVAVTFDENDMYGRPTKKQYTYKAPKDMTIAEGDKLLVVVKSRNPDEYKVVTVQAVNTHPQIDPAAAFTYKWVIGKLDDIMAPHRDQVAKDERLQAALKTLDAAIARVEASTRLKMALETLPSNIADELRQAFGLAQEHDASTERAGGTD